MSYLLRDLLIEAAGTVAVTFADGLASIGVRRGSFARSKGARDALRRFRAARMVFGRSRVAIGKVPSVLTDALLANRRRAAA